MNSRDAEKGRVPGVEASLYHQLKKATQAAADIIGNLAGRHDLTLSQYALLESLVERDGASQTELVEITGIDRSTLADVAKRLERRGFIRRKRSRRDRRVKELHLTEAGMAALLRMAPVMAQADRLLLDVLDDDRRKEFLAALALLASMAEGSEARRMALLAEAARRHLRGRAGGEEGQERRDGGGLSPSGPAQPAPRM